MTTVLMMLFAGFVGVMARKVIRWWRYRRLPKAQVFIERDSFQCPECGSQCQLDRYPPADLKKDHQMWLCSGYCGLGFEVPRWQETAEDGRMHSLLLLRVKRPLRAKLSI